MIDEQRSYSEKKHFQGDPFAAWQVWFVARQYKRPIPDWVLSHFDSVSEAIAVEIRRLSGRDRSQARALSILGRAVGFRNDGRGGRGDAFSKQKRAHRDADASALVGQLIGHGWQPKAAIIEVARATNVSVATVSRAYYHVIRRKSQ